jgi:hypothetical protein
MLSVPELDAVPLAGACERIRQLAAFISQLPILGKIMQSRSSQPKAIAITESETYQTLLARAQRRTGGVPPESIERHILSVTHGGDWPVQRDALDAVLRRCASAQTDVIQIVRRPRGRLLGLYATRRRGSRTRPYRMLLRRIEPLDGSCECADFLRNSLGLCKHLFAVLERVISRPRHGDFERELRLELAPLRWDSVRPLTGPGDWGWRASAGRTALRTGCRARAPRAWIYQRATLHRREARLDGGRIPDRAWRVSSARVSVAQDARGVNSRHARQ